MRYTILLVALFFLLMPPSISLADGNNLLNVCKKSLLMFDSFNSGGSGGDFTSDDTKHSYYCIGFAPGTVAMNAAYKLLLSNKALFCSPQEITNTQTIRVIVKYLQDHPERLHENETTLAISALYEAFPYSSTKK